MFGSKKRKRIENAFGMLVKAGRDIAGWNQHEGIQQWERGPMWIWFCGTIPAFAVLIHLEASKSRNQTETQKFLKSVEEWLFVFYKDHAPNALAPLNLAVPVPSERQKVCQTYGVSDDTNMGVETIMGIIFPGRLQRYQRDLKLGFRSAIQSGYEGAILQYICMRLAADLCGIETPDSLEGCSADDLGITGSTNALMPLTELVTAHQQMFSN